MLRLNYIAPIAGVYLLAACATTTTRLAPIAQQDVVAEEAAQRVMVLQELAAAQKRLDDLSFPLLRAAVPVCQSKSGPRMGAWFKTIDEFDGPWIPAARTALHVSDTVTVASVIAGSPAELGGLRSGDRIIAVGGTLIPPGRRGIEAMSKLLYQGAGGATTFQVYRPEGATELTIHPETVCALGAIVTVEGEINAYADGKNVIFPWAMMRFAADDELRAVIAHEIAHNSMGHLEARKKNAAWGAFFGALADVALATQGVNTGGENTASFMQLGAMAFSQDFEREADYVGMYIMARAGVPLAAGPNLWRQFAQINPAAIGYASTHPTTAERFVRLRAAIAEIESKKLAGADLLPELKAGSTVVPVANSPAPTNVAGIPIKDSGARLFQTAGSSREIGLIPGGTLVSINGTSGTEWYDVTYLDTPTSQKRGWIHVSSLVRVP